MNVALVYFSRGGNTRKIAEAIEEELRITPINVKKESPDVSNADILIVGTALTEGRRRTQSIKRIREKLKM
jgi:flavodoxin